MALAFKGGKESIVVLHKYIYLDPIVFTIVYNNFQEINDYMKEIESIYNIFILKFYSLDKAIDYLKSKHCRTIITGCKNTDIGWYCDTLYQSMAPKYHGMECFNPIIAFTYQNTWHYIEQENLPVCSLYTQGYTYIGKKGQTFPNYFLFDKDHYKHAKKLTEGSLEKQGIILNTLPITYTGTLHKHIFNVSTILDDGIYYGTLNNEPILIVIKNKIKIKHKNIDNATLIITGFLRRGNKLNDKDKQILSFLTFNSPSDVFFHHNTNIQ